MSLVQRVRFAMINGRYVCVGGWPDFTPGEERTNLTYRHGEPRAEARSAKPGARLATAPHLHGRWGWL